MKVHVEPYNPAWTEEFAAAKTHLDGIFKDVEGVDVVHVGSTSVVGLPAKPIIDIDCIVDADQLVAARTAMTKAGYLDLGEMNIDGRFVFRQPGYKAYDYATGVVAAAPPDSHAARPKVTPLGLRMNTYVCIRGGQAVRNHLDTKRVLSSDDELRTEYGNVKLTLAAKGDAFETLDDYSRAKNDILAKILRRAGWTKEELDEVRRMNEL